MANPERREGFFKISNEAAERLAQTNLTGDESRCLWVILRRTLGWQKTEDRISLSQFAKLTGRRRQRCWTALKSLREQCIITVTASRCSQILSYAFQKDCSKWKVLHQAVTVTGGMLQPSHQAVTELSQQAVTTSTKDSKDILQKTKTLGGEKSAATLLSEKDRKFKARFHRELEDWVIRKTRLHPEKRDLAKEHGILENLIKRYGLYPVYREFNAFSSWGKHSLGEFFDAAKKLPERKKVK